MVWDRNWVLLLVECLKVQCWAIGIFIAYKWYFKAVRDSTVRSFADDTALLTSNTNLDTVIQRTKRHFVQLYIWYLYNKLFINDKTHYALIHAKTLPVFKNMEITETEYVTIYMVKNTIRRNYQPNAHVKYVYGSLLKYFETFNLIKSHACQRVVRRLFFAFINFQIRYGIGVFGHCTNEYLDKLQTQQNKFLKVLLKLDWRTSTNQLHRNISLLKVSDIHTVGLLSCFSWEQSW